MMLDDSYPPSHSCSGCHLQPLTRIRLCSRSKKARVFISVSPFPAGVGIHTIMEKRIELRLLPLQLTGMRHRVYRRRFIVRIRKILLSELQLRIRHDGSDEHEREDEYERLHLI